jgi:hypothetical protein
MSTLKKFDYVVDSSSMIVVSGQVWDEWLSTLCPVLVTKLREAADKVSSSRLYLSISKSLTILEAGKVLASIFGEDFLPDEAKRYITDAKLFLAISSSELSKRYLANTLEPELHVGNGQADEYARQQVAQEPQEPVATESDGDWIDESGAGVSPVNSVADGIA